MYACLTRFLPFSSTGGSRGDVWEIIFIYTCHKINTCKLFATIVYRKPRQVVNFVETPFSKKAIFDILRFKFEPHNLYTSIFIFQTYKKKKTITFNVVQCYLLYHKVSIFNITHSIKYYCFCTSSIPYFKNYILLNRV